MGRDRILHHPECTSVLVRHIILDHREIVISRVQPKKYDVQAVRDSFPPEKAWSEMQGDFFCYLLYRPISFWVTPWFLNRRVPVMAVTLGALCVAVTMVTIAAVGGRFAWVGVALLGLTYHVLDCVDGNMARTLGRSTRLGAILDGTVDMIFWCLLLVSLGLLVDHAGGTAFGGHPVSVSLLLCVLLLLNRQTRDNFAVQNATQTYFKPEKPQSIRAIDWLMMILTGLEFVYVFVIAFAGLLGRLDWALMGIGTYVTAIFIGALWMTFSKAAELDSTTSSNDPR
ncbi:CDP-alcohol phosphatidyltransferase family protein [Myxococcota bacterium]|nr:CDP-alcohol phosphatidyltransferase family protein [Myxococcota bacterium]